MGYSLQSPAWANSAIRSWQLDGNISDMLPSTSGIFRMRVGNPELEMSQEVQDLTTFICHECGQQCNRKILLLRHIKQHHEKTMQYSCITCRKGFRGEAHLKEHLRIHNGAKPYSCVICQKSFRQRSHLNVHSLIHSGEKSHSCVVCQKSFRQKYNLTTHSRIHSGEKPFFCVVCKKSFRRKYHLAIHYSRMRTAEKPYKCYYCGQSFIHKSSTARHYLAVHSGLKSFSCSMCEKRCSFNSYLGHNLCVNSLTKKNHVLFAH